MIISTKGRYALRVMLDLAEQDPEKYVPLKDISERQEISHKYIETIMTSLHKGNLVDAHHGKGGGFKLNRQPKDYSVYEILAVTENTLVPVSCLEKDGAPCHRMDTCQTRALWEKFSDNVHSFFEGITLDDLCQGALSIDED